MKRYLLTVLVAATLCACSTRSEASGPPPLLALGLIGLASGASAADKARSQMAGAGNIPGYQNRDDYYNYLLGRAPNPGLPAAAPSGPRAGSGWTGPAAGAGGGVYGPSLPGQAGTPPAMGPGARPGPYGPSLPGGITPPAAAGGAMMTAQGGAGPGGGPMRAAPPRQPGMSISPPEGSIGTSGGLQNGMAPTGPDARGAPMVADSSFRGDQGALVRMLQQQASGQGPSLAALQTREALDRGLAQQRSFAAGARPGNSAAAARMAAQNMSQLNQGAASQEQQGRLAEALAAQQALGGVLQGARAQDLQLGGLNQAGQLQTTQMNDQRLLQLLQLQQQQAIAQGTGQFAAQQAAAQMPTGWQTALGTAGQLAGYGAMLSDERAKEGIRDARAEIDQLLAALRPVAYSYKDPAHGEGEIIGVIAQDVERSEVGRALVEEVDGLKQIDLLKGFGVLLAAVGRIDERLRKLEEAKG